MNNQPLSVLMATEFKHVLVVKKLRKRSTSDSIFKTPKSKNLWLRVRTGAQNSILTVPKYRLDPAHFSNVILRLVSNENDEERKERVKAARNF